MNNLWLWHNEGFAICPACDRWSFRVRSVGTSIPSGGSLHSVDARCLKCGFHIKGGAVDCDVVCPEVTEWDLANVVKKCLPCMVKSRAISLFISPKEGIAVISETTTRSKGISKGDK